MENDEPKDKEVDKTEESEPKSEKTEKPEFAGIRFVEDVPSSNPTDDIEPIKNEPNNSEQKVEPGAKESVPLEAAEPEMPEVAEPEIVEPEHKRIEVEKVESVTTVVSVSPESEPVYKGEDKSTESLTYVEKPAGFWLRFTAFQLDGFIIGVITLFVSLALVSVLAVDGVNFGAGFLEVVNQFLIYSSEKQNYLLMNIVSIAIPFIYSITFLVTKGASPGKMLLCIRVERESGDGHLSLLNAFLRTIGYIVSFLPFLLGFIWAGFNRQKKAWHDVLASTKVVQYKKISFLRVVLAYFLPILPYFILPIIFIPSFSMESMESVMLNSSKIITALVNGDVNQVVVERQLIRKSKPLVPVDVQNSKDEGVQVSDSIQSTTNAEMPIMATENTLDSADIETDDSAGSIEDVLNENIQTVEDSSLEGGDVDKQMEDIEEVSSETVIAPELISDNEVLESDNEAVEVDMQVGDGSMLIDDSSAEENVPVSAVLNEEESLPDEVSLDVVDVILESEASGGSDDGSLLSPQVLLDDIVGEDADNVSVEVAVEQLSKIAMDAKPVTPEDVAANRIDVRIEPLVVERADGDGTKLENVEVEIVAEVLARDDNVRQEDDVDIINTEREGKESSMNEELARKYFEIGRGYHQKGDISQAEQFFENAIKVDPVFVKARIFLASVYEKQGLYDNSIEEYNEIIRVDPGRAKAHIDLGHLFYLKGNKRLAIETIKKAIEIEPDNTEAYILLGVVYQKFDMFDDAIRAHKSALKINSDLALPHLNMGNIFYKKRNERKAVKAYKKAIEIDPGLVEARNNLGYIYYSKGKNKKAIYEFRKAIELKYEYKRAHKNLSLAYKRAGMVDAATKEEYIASSLP